MYLQIVFLFVYILFAACVCLLSKDKKHGKKTVVFVFASALVLRLCISFFTNGYKTDMNCFRSWSTAAAGTLPWRFYDSIWCDYPPGYLYVLAPIGFLKNLFPAMPGRAFNVLIKLPACVCDILGGMFIYKTAKKHLGEGSAFKCAALFLFCPAIIINSAVWGQADSVFTLLAALSFYELYGRKYFKSAFLLGLSMSVKMQTLMFAPVFAYVFLERIQEDKKLWKTLLGCIGVFLAVPCLLALPFAALKPPAFMLNLYFSTMGQYPYASLNAFNLFALLGANQQSAFKPFFFLTFRAWGLIFIALSVLYAGFLYLKGKGRGKILYTAALLVTLIFVFSSDMHERYLFPAILLYVAAFALSGDRKTLYIAAALALSQYINVGYLYNMSQSGVYHIPPQDILLKAGSIFTVGTAFFAVYNFRALYLGETERFKIKDGYEKRITRKDVLIISAVTFLYAVLAFANLGDKASPQTTFVESGTHEAVVSFDAERHIGSIIYYKGIGKGNIAVLSSADGDNFKSEGEFETGACFRWERISCDISAKYVYLKTLSGGITVYEAGFTDFDTGEVIAPLETGEPWFDEQALVPDVISYRNGTYFDEIYHARTAFENIEGIYPYEVSHPPLGKLIIALGIKMFGMNPFGWRFMGTVFGVLMLPLMFVFAKRIFKNSKAALVSMLLLTFDFMHFTQTRIATIDSFSVFFIILMYYFMYIYYDSTAKELPYKKALGVLALCGLSFGLGAATKWICIYAGAGLAVLFAIATARREKDMGGTWFKTCLWCVLFFGLVPFAIYFASYAPYYVTDKTRSALRIFLDNQTYMLSYHGKLTAKHSFQSPWYTWPFDIRPIWYFGASDRIPRGTVSSIVSFGNPLIWWFGTAALSIAAAFGMRNKKILFLCTAFLSQYLPWALVSRAVFIYHFFASIPFVILTLTYAFEYLSGRYLRGKAAAICFIVLCGVVFCMFYPVLSGMAVSRSYVKSVLSWLGSWTLSY